MEHLIRVLLSQMEAFGYQVTEHRDSQTIEYVATCKRTKEVFIVRATLGDEYAAVCELAGVLGVDLTDG